ncbi:MAG TPA: 6-phosphofructokinase [Candidatus Hydrogenedentes bacterium]|jgi:6-phosphofructokinase 1|nr:6-phosphofructokinase [FCB group bacterium]HNZ20399.1 6-phosphofructokinase [Candidatus Hydrogenedentota bacterium]HOH35876.1 6-phosphofructokinase [Candidatus Hydrogenedentota bacterium]HPA06161.1 6-phosphofructokinase [Candidatus Hydrogenedentota bacterium]HPV38918.1 6-phosphofructokinase [Candidatus Hydrogenedentota bacterium]
MAEVLKGKVLVAQGGGPTAVINQSMVGAVLESRKFPQVTRVYGAVHGVRGIIEEDFLDLTEATTHNLEAVAQTPSSGLCSTRDKPDVEYCRKVFQVCQAHEVRYFFYIGGNDSADTCRIVNEEADKAGYELRVIHIPKTIDNDLKVTDHCPGYGSAAKFVAQAFAGVNLDNRAIPGVYIGIVMGRHAGFLTAASVLGKKYPDDGPHLVYLPERPFNKKQFVQDVQSVYTKYGRCIIAASEGIVDAKGVAIASQFTGGEKDSHGNVQLSGTGALGDLLASWIKAETGIKRVRADTLGYLQRSFLGCVSEVDQFEAREVGEKAAQFAIWHNRDGSVVIRRIGDYAVEYDLAKLKDVARESVCMPDKFINKQANGVTDAFLRYARPLIGELPIMERIAAPKVARILKNK